MNLDYLRDFVVFAEHLNFSRAATAAHKSQSALSKHIAALEHEIGVELVSRDTRSLNLTPLGRAFLEDAMNVVRSHDNAVERLKQLRRMKPSKLTIGALMSYRPYADLVRAAIVELRRRLPVSDVRVSEDLSITLVEALKCGRADLIMSGFPNSQGLERYTSLPLFRDPLVAIVPKGHRLSERAALIPSDLAHETILTSMKPAFSDYTKLLEDLFLNHGIEIILNDRVYDSPDEYFSLDYNYGITIMPSGYLYNIPMPRLNEYTILQFDNDDFSMRYGAVYGPVENNEALAVFVEALKRATEAMDKDFARKTLRELGGMSDSDA
ncbi:MAG: LysR substrate-binding domain-containing protein [Coriobacteriia bacterium]